MVVLCFAIRWDSAAMVTIVPFPLWCALGAVIAGVSLLWKRTAPGLVVLALWTATFLWSDELRAWKNWGHPSPSPAGPAAATSTGGQRPLRLVSYNTHLQSVKAAAEIKAWNPDIVFLQESPWPHQLRDLAGELFGPDALIAMRPDCAIIARGKSLQVFDLQWPVPLPGGVPWAVCGRLTLPDGRAINLLNVHLLAAERNWHFWTRQAWRQHAENRRNRRFQLSLLLSAMRTIAEKLPPVPTIVAGDFNAPARDSGLMVLPSFGFRDSYELAASRPGNTFPNHFPLHRIDQAWFSSDLAPVSHTTHKGMHSDHRMLIVDFLMP